MRRVRSRARVVDAYAMTWAASWPCGRVHERRWRRGQPANARGLAGVGHVARRNGRIAKFVEFSIEAAHPVGGGWQNQFGEGRGGEGREGKGREGKGREGKGREGVLYHCHNAPLPDYYAQVNRPPTTGGAPECSVLRQPAGTMPGEWSETSEAVGSISSHHPALSPKERGQGPC